GSSRSLRPASARASTRRPAGDCYATDLTERSGCLSSCKIEGRIPDEHLGSAYDRMPNSNITPELLRRFSPLDSLKRENIAALAKKTEIRTLEAGKVLLREGDVDKRTFYLVSGTLELEDRNGNVRLLRAKTDDARNPVTPMLPRRYTVRAVDQAEYISVDTDLLDVMLTWDQT